MMDHWWIQSANHVHRDSCTVDWWLMDPYWGRSVPEQTADIWAGNSRAKIGPSVSLTIIPRATPVAANWPLAHVHPLSTKDSFAFRCWRRPDVLRRSDLKSRLPSLKFWWNRMFKCKSDQNLVPLNCLNIRAILWWIRYLWFRRQDFHRYKTHLGTDICFAFSKGSWFVSDLICRPGRNGQRQVVRLYCRAINKNPKKEPYLKSHHFCKGPLQSWEIVAISPVPFWGNCCDTAVVAQSLMGTPKHWTWFQPANRAELCKAGAAGARALANRAVRLPWGDGHQPSSHNCLESNKK